MKQTSLTVVDTGLEQIILELRGQKVIIDRDLAALYKVPTKALNQAVKRNLDRFPPEFCFRLTASELSGVVTNCDHLQPLKFTHELPWAFTEHGSLMAATVLNSERATQMSLFLIRTFAKMRKLLLSQDELRAALAQIESKLIGHDRALKCLFTKLDELLSSKRTACREIGFHAALKISRKSPKRTLTNKKNV